ncbi:ABC transporter permease subunit [Bacillus marinisedimentorum]|uniref:ABC transporter permease subunit n=1 Tax=Bacillus marinisedimentorum TaxID=1821260 RepID=UPI000871E61D|nr:ABC transporter permease subunit [Bacillus marinisedimentorum]
MLARLIKNELLKIALNKKLYVFMVVMALFTFLPAFEKLIGQVPFDLTGQNLPMYMLTTHVMILLPLFAIIIITDMITDEYVSGTLKLSLLHPVSRASLLTAKIISLFISLLFLLLYAAFFAYLLGSIIWGFGDSLVFDGVEYATLDGIIKTVGSYIVSAFPLTAFGTFIMLAALLLSSNGGALGVSVGFLIFLNLAGELFPFLRPYLLVDYFRGLAKYLFFTEEYNQAVIGIFIIVIYGIATYIISLIYFKKKDLLY